MRSVQKKQQYERSIIGMIKDISFHELFIEKFREENARNDLFDFEMAYQIIDTFKSEKVSPYQIQGFLAKNGMQSTQNECEEIVTSIDKSAIFISKKYFMEICMPKNKELRSLSSNRYQRIKVSINDFDFWTRIKIQTERQLVRLFSKQVQFYRELQERRQIFCHNFYGDVYSIANVFQHKDQINYQMLYEFCKKYKIILNKDEYQALIRRAISANSEQIRQFMKKDEFIGLFITKNLNLKPAFKKKYEISKRYDPLNFSYNRKQNISDNTFNTQFSQSIQLKVLQMEQPKDLKYQFYYPEVRSKYGIGLVRLQQKSKLIDQMVHKISSNPTLQRIYYNSINNISRITNFNDYSTYGLHHNKY